MGNLPFKEQLYTHTHTHTHIHTHTQLKKPLCISKQAIPGEQACSVQSLHSSCLWTSEKHIKWNKVSAALCNNKNKVLTVWKYVLFINNDLH